jgi:heme oxygenase
MNAPSLSSRLRDATHSIHRTAERTGLMQDFLRGQVEPYTYCALLRNWQALYEALEGELERHADLPEVAAVRFPVLFRSVALVQDLNELHGARWASLPLTEAMQNYVERIHQLGDEQPTLLAAHAYVRYMADLSGGQILADVVSKAFSSSPSGAGTAFYRIDVDPTAMKAQFRAALDDLPVDPETADDLVIEAQSGFELHVRLFEELASVVSAGH